VSRGGGGQVNGGGGVTKVAPIAMQTSHFASFETSIFVAATPLSQQAIYSSRCFIGAIALQQQVEV
jgi:hypothetical protein